MISGSTMDGFYFWRRRSLLKREIIALNFCRNSRSKLNFLPLAANLPPVHDLRNSQTFSYFHHVFCTCSKFHDISAEISAWLIISAQLRPAPHRSAIAQQRSVVQCRAL